MKTIVHPIFIYLIIAILSCLSVGNDEVILYELPHEGDNFKVSGLATVYYYRGGAKYSYEGQACFFSYPNPPFSTDYRQGGIKTIAAEIAEVIPLAGSMCGEKQRFKDKKMPQKSYFSRAFWLAYFSEIAHVLLYFLWGLSLLWYLKKEERLYLKTLIIVLFGGILLEIIQGVWITGRTASAMDIGWNMAGAGAAIAVFPFLLKWLRARAIP